MDGNQEMFPILYLGAIVVKVRTEGRVTNRPVYVAMAVDLDGAEYWLGVLTELHNRGVTDIRIACCDGLTGFGDAIEAVWPQATVQTCVVHLIRNSIRFCSYKDRRAVAKALKPIYTAATVEAAGVALEDFETTWGHTYGAIVDIWRRNWDRFVPFLDFDPAIRKIIYTTNAIESLNYQLRKVTKTKGSFPATTRCSRSSTSPSTGSDATAEANSAPTPKAGNKHSTRSPSPTPAESQTHSTNRLTQNS